MNISFKAEANLSEKSPKCHFLPCKIEKTGDVPVSKYFEPTIKEQEDGNLEASFRGRQLNGQKIDLPDSHTGIVISRLADDPPDDWKVTDEFRSFSCWNWDKEPSDNDKMRQSLVWIDLANAMHKSQPKLLEDSSDTK